MRPPEIQKGKHYRIVEGRLKGKVGSCIDVKSSSFGRVWAKLALGPNQIVTKRASDLQPIDSSGYRDYVIGLQG